MTEDEKFFAWLDGELEPAEATAMEAKVAADPSLAALAEQHRLLDNQLRHAFDSVAAAPLPKKLTDALRPSAEVIDFTQARRRRTLPLPLLRQWPAIAATLAVGVFAGTLVPQHAGGPIAVEHGKIYAAAGLGRALDEQLASAPSGDVRIGITFRSRGGQICRTFTQPAASGLACRSGDQWQIRGLFGAPEGQASDYRMAAGLDPNLAALVDSTIAGEALDAAQEKVEQERHWK